MDKSADKTIDAFLAGEDKLLDRIEVLETALKEIYNFCIYQADPKATFSKIDEIVTKALWPT